MQHGTAFSGAHAVLQICSLQHGTTATENPPSKNNKRITLARHAHTTNAHCWCPACCRSSVGMSTRRWSATTTSTRPSPPASSASIRSTGTATSQCELACSAVPTRATVSRASCASTRTRHVVGAGSASNLFWRGGERVASFPFIMKSNPLQGGGVG